MEQIRKLHVFPCHVMTRMTTGKRLKRSGLNSSFGVLLETAQLTEGVLWGGEVNICVV